MWHICGLEATCALMRCIRKHPLDGCRQVLILKVPLSSLHSLRSMDEWSWGREADRRRSRSVGSILLLAREDCRGMWLKEANLKPFAGNLLLSTTVVNTTTRLRGVLYKQPLKSGRTKGAFLWVVLMEMCNYQKSWLRVDRWIGLLQ